MVSEDNDIFQSIPKDSTIFYWIPTICDILKSKSESGYIKILIDVAKKEIKKIMVSITKNKKNDIRNKYLFRMLPNIDESEVLRNREMICYLQSIKFIEEYIKNQNLEKNLNKAIIWYKKGEINGKKYLESITTTQNYQNLTGRYFY